MELRIEGKRTISSILPVFLEWKKEDPSQGDSAEKHPKRSDVLVNPSISHDIGAQQRIQARVHLALAENVASKFENSSVNKRDILRVSKCQMCHRNHTVDLVQDDPDGIQDFSSNVASQDCDSGNIC